MCIRDRPYLVPLSATAPAPFGAAADGWPISKVQSDASPSTDKKDEAPKQIVSVELDADGFEERLVPFPVPSGDYQDLRAAKDGVLWRRVVAPAGELGAGPVSYTHLRAHETRHDLVCRLLLEKKKQ